MAEVEVRRIKNPAGKQKGKGGGKNETTKMRLHERDQESPEQDQGADARYRYCELLPIALQQIYRIAIFGRSLHQRHLFLLERQGWSPREEKTVLAMLDRMDYHVHQASERKFAKSHYLLNYQRKRIQIPSLLAFAFQLREIAEVSTSFVVEVSDGFLLEVRTSRIHTNQNCKKKNKKKSRTMSSLHRMFLLM